MQAMASMGDFGAHPQNCHRALLNLLGLPAGAPDLHWATIPTARGENTLHPFLLPHEFFRQYYIGQRAKWASTMTGPVNAALDFWQAMAGTDYLRLHPALPKSKWTQTVPLGLHGDGAAVSHQDSLYVFSWNSLIGSGATVQKRFLATIIKKTDMVPGTVDAIMKILRWSFSVMFSGQKCLRWTGR